MSRQYIRAYKLTVLPDDGNTITINSLRISFELTKSVLSFPNLFKIDIYNPNNTTLSVLQKKFTKIVFNAGYEGNIRLLFKGDIRNVFQKKQSADRIVTIYAGDGQRDWQNSFINKTFTENVKTKSVIEEVMRTFKELSVGALEGLPDITDKLRGQSLSGSSKDILDNFAEEYGFNWSIQNGEIITTPVEAPLTSSEAVLVTSSTGMIGSPTITEIGADAVTLLNPSLLPNSAFKIESVSADAQLGNLFFRNVKKTSGEGLYKIQEVLFKGDSKEAQWLSMVKGRSINA